MATLSGLLLIVFVAVLVEWWIVAGSLLVIAVLASIVLFMQRLDAH